MINNPLTRLSMLGTIIWMAMIVCGVLLAVLGSNVAEGIGLGMLWTCMGYLFFGFLIKYRLPEDAKLKPYPDDLNKINAQYSEIQRLREKNPDISS